MAYYDSVYLPCLQSYLGLTQDEYNKAAEEPPHPRSQISAFVVAPCKVYYQNVSIFYLVPVAEQAGLNLTQKTGFLM